MWFYLSKSRTSNFLLHVVHLNSSKCKCSAALLLVKKRLQSWNMAPFHSCILFICTVLRKGLSTSIQLFIYFLFLCMCVNESADHSAASTRKHTDIDKRKNSTSSQKRKASWREKIYIRKITSTILRFLWIDANKADIIPEERETEDRQLSG